LPIINNNKYYQLAKNNSELMASGMHVTINLQLNAFYIS